MALRIDCYRGIANKANVAAMAKGFNRMIYTGLAA
jgi:hypothetical protein